MMNMITEAPKKIPPLISQNAHNNQKIPKGHIQVLDLIDDYPKKIPQINPIKLS